jgi:hypothetical protein
MRLKSVFENKQKIPSKFSRLNGNINPPLEILDAPTETKSFVLIVDDPDAPSKIWVHWLVWNFLSTKIPEGKFPAGSVEGKNDFGNIHYDGPSPPSGTHRYFFRVYALDRKLNLRYGSSRKELENAINGHILEKTELIGLYSCQN